MTNIHALIQDAQNHLNFRSRGRDARLDRLAACGVPTDRAGMAAWLQEARDRLHEAAGGVFHACTVRVSNGCDADLPTLNGIGCRITRVPVQAELDEIGEAAEESFWLIHWGNVGVGYMETTYLPLDAAATSDEAASIARKRLLQRGDCFRTRAEAEAAVKKMLADRVEVN